MIKLAQIRQFVALAEEGNFHRAARVLNMAQPPLSVGIRKLEDDLDVQLFVRGPRGVKLTPAGELALISARQALFHVEEMRIAVRKSVAGERGRLRVGFVASATLDLLPRLLIAYRAQYPQIELKLDESRDLALLKFESTTPLRSVRVAMGQETANGENVTIISNPGLGKEVLDNTLTTGVVSNVRS